MSQVGKTEFYKNLVCEPKLSSSFLKSKSQNLCYMIVDFLVVRFSVMSKLRDTCMCGAVYGAASSTKALLIACG